MLTVNCQGGIADPPPEHALVVALSLVPSDTPSCQTAMQSLRELIRRELAADIDEIDPDSNPGVPSVDTGEIGVDTGYDTTRLTVTMGVSSSGFQKLGLAAAQLPLDLIPIDWGSFGDQPTNAASGDILLQICADSSYIVEHVLRRIEHDLSSGFAVAWTLAGEQRNGGPHGAPLTADTAHALIGFHDGLSNLDPNDSTDQQLIFVGQAGAPACPPPPPPGQQPPPQPGQPGYGQPGSSGPIFPTDLRTPPSQAEPAWMTGGSYLMVRASILNIASWDAETLQQQELAVGRWKYSGAPLDVSNSPAHRHDPPAFATAPTNVQVPNASHIRRANPRALPTDPLRRIFRQRLPTDRCI